MKRNIAEWKSNFLIGGVDPKKQQMVHIWPRIYILVFVHRLVALSPRDLFGSFRCRPALFLLRVCLATSSHPWLGNKVLRSIGVHVFMFDVAPLCIRPRPLQVCMDFKHRVGHAGSVYSRRSPTSPPPFRTPPFPPTKAQNNVCVW